MFESVSPPSGQGFMHVYPQLLSASVSAFASPFQQADARKSCRAVSEAELSILHLRERMVQQVRSKRIQIGSVHRLVSQFAPSVPCVKELRVRSDTLSKLSARGQSTVARTSLAARHRWEWALRRVLTMIRICKVFQQSSI